ncbi:MAG: GumC family protein [Armatimonadota bacterium]
MSEPYVNPEAEQEAKLPIDIRTLLIGLWRRKFILVIMIALFAGLAYLGGRMMNKSIYQTTTVLLYKPSEEKKREILDIGKSLMTQVSMVKVKPNLEDVRRKLNLAASLDAVGQAIDVSVEKNTEIISITATWDDAKLSADIANQIRDTFLANGVRIDKEAASGQIRDVSKRLATVTAALKVVDSELQVFSEKTNYTEFVEMSKAALDQFNQMDLLWEQAKSDQKTLSEQVKNLGTVIKQLKDRVSGEQKQMFELDRLSNINTRIENLRQKITDDKELRSNAAQLAQRELELARAKRLLESGAISQTQYEAARLAYEEQKVRSIDSDQVKQWKDQLEQLYRVVIPSNLGSTPSGDMLQEMLKKEFDLQLDQISVAERVKNFALARQSAVTRVESLPSTQRQYLVLSRNLKNLEDEKTQLLDVLGKAKRFYGSDSYDFVLISDAKVPSSPIKSNRKTLTMGIFAFGVIITLALILGMELSDTRIKSAPDMAARLGVPAIGQLPHLDKNQRQMPTEQGVVTVEEFSVIARLIRQLCQQHGNRLLVCSARHSEGTTTIVAHVAASLGRQDENVLIIDGGSEDISITELCTPEQLAGAGIGDYLEGKVANIDEIIKATKLRGVSIIPRIGTTVTPDMISSKRMATLMDELGRRYSIVMVEASAVLDNVDAELLSQTIDYGVFVVKSRYQTASNIRKAMDRLKLGGCPVYGAVANEIDKLYLV